MPWTSLDDEAALYSSLEATGRVAVTQVGQSVQGRPIRLLRIGDPPPAATEQAALLMLGVIHGHEPAGREAMLQLAEHLSTTSAPDELAFLAEHGLLMIPTVNPDGFELGTRRNANDIDLNRDFIALEEPESRALAAVLGATRPLVFVDTHESNMTESDLEFRRTGNPQVPTTMSERAAHVIDAMKARMDIDGWIYADANVNQSEIISRGNGPLRHSVTVILESHGFSPSPPLPPEDRVAIQLACLEEALRYVVDHADGLHADRDAVDAATVQAGAAGAPFNLRTTILDPAAVAYRLNAAQISATAFQREVFNIAMQGELVSMAQFAGNIIPYIMDPDAEFSIIDAERVFAAPPPADVGDDLAAGTFQPVVTWLGCDLVTGRIIADLPDLDGNISRLLGAHTSASLKMPIPLSGPGALGDLALQATQPRRTMIVAVINDQPAWAGIVHDRLGGTDATLDLPCASLESYYEHRYVRGHNWTQQDEAAVIAAGLAGDAGTILGVGSGIGIEIDAPPTGTLRDRTYVDGDNATVYNRLRELADIDGGIEWTIELLWGDDTQTWVRKVLRIRKRIGVAHESPAAVFEVTAPSVFASRGSSEATYRYTERHSSGRGANVVTAYSSGQGDDQPRSAPAVDTAQLATGVPIYERRFQPASGITRIATLNGHAQRELQLRRNGALLWEIEARWNTFPRLNIDWRIGDDVAWNVVGHRHPHGVTGQGRCIGWDLNPSAGTVKPILLDPDSGG